MLKKEHKILVVVSPEPAERKRLLSRLAVRLGFALIPSDAAKIISTDIYGIDLATAYFVFAATTISVEPYSLTSACMKWRRGACVWLWESVPFPVNMNSSARCSIRKIFRDDIPGKHNAEYS